MNSGISYAVGAAALFGLSVPLAKMLVGDMHPISLAGLLYIGSGIGLGLLIALRRLLPRTRRLPIAWPRPSDIPWLGAAILFGGIAAPVLLMFGLQTSTASSASLLLNLESVFTTLLAWFLFRENFDRRIAVGILLIIVGGVFLSWEPSGENGLWAGAPLVAAACLCWALDNNLTRRVSSSDALAVSCVKGLVAGITNLALAATLAIPVPKESLMLAAALVGFFGYGVSLVLFVMALRNLGTARTGAYFSVAPFFGAVLAIPLHGESLTWQLTAAGFLMGAGVWLHLTERHDHEHCHEGITHTHSHQHDEHHQHPHSDGEATSGVHTHEHAHKPQVHSHSHFPDIHHRHGHG